MGLRQLEWREQSDEGWAAWEAVPFDTNPSRYKRRKYAHVDIYPWALQGAMERVAGKVLVDMMIGDPGYSWHDSIEAAKLHVEAIFALDND